MANTLATPTWVTKEVARFWLNSIKFVLNMTRTYDDQYIQNGARVGNTVKARLPQRFQVTDGQALQVQGLFDQTVNISLTNQKGVAFSYSSAQATTELDEIRSRYVQPAAESLANAADKLAVENVYKDVYNAIGSPGAGEPSTPLAYLEAGVKLTDFGTMVNNRVAVLDAMQLAVISNAASTLFNPAPVISENYRTGALRSAQLGIEEWWPDPNMPVHVTGTYTASTPLVNGANQTGASLITDGWASGASSLKRGDVFTIADVFSVNPVSYQSTGRLQQFVVTADISDTTGAMTIAISPSIITSGALQTVTASPANNAVITVLGATSASGGTLATTNSKQGMVYHPDAFAFVMADLIKPTAGAEASFARSKQWGIMIRMVEQYQIQTDQNPSRLDILIGAASIFPNRAVRVFS